jgi:putative phosphoribosyl transferase
MKSFKGAFVSPFRDKSIEPLQNRVEAGQKLAAQLSVYSNRPDVLVLGLPRGGVPVAYEIAQALHVPLDIILVRKLGVPGHKELAMGAIASGGIRILNEDVVWGLGVPDQVIDSVAAKEEQELERREQTYRRDRPRLDVRDKTIILVDDGIATGATLRSAIAALRTQRPQRIVVAVGVAPAETCRALEAEVDEVVCLLQPDPFWAVGVWYDEFGAVSDQEVCQLLAQK